LETGAAFFHHLWIVGMMILMIYDSDYDNDNYNDDDNDDDDKNDKDDNDDNDNDDDDDDYDVDDVFSYVLICNLIFFFNSSFINQSY
jgi:hypothetical protein